jgi:hypothetical protein
VEDSSAKRLLRGARELVVRSWCRGSDARDAAGRAVDPWDERAVSWSLLGAIVATLEDEAQARGELPLEQLAVALYALAEVIECDSLAAWNDAPGRTQSTVVAVLEQAASGCDRARREVSLSAN